MATELQSDQTSRESSFGYFLKKITFSDGTDLSLDRNSILVITGPNNCGKSQCLKDLCFYSSISVGPSGVVVAKSEIEFTGDEGLFLEELLRHPHVVHNEMFVSTNFNALGRNVPAFLSHLRQHPQIFDAAIQVLTRYVTTGNRLSALLTSYSPQPFVIQPQPSLIPLPIRGIFEDEALEDKFHNIVNRVVSVGK